MAGSASSGRFRHLYRTGRWQATRKAQLQSEPLCRYCAQLGQAVAASVCDHINGHPTTETEEQFWGGPFQSLCRTCHDGAKRSQEARGWLRGCDESGNPVGRADW